MTATRERMADVGGDRRCRSPTSRRRSARSRAGGVAALPLVGERDGLAAGPGARHAPRASSRPAPCRRSSAAARAPARRPGYVARSRRAPGSVPLKRSPSTHARDAGHRRAVASTARTSSRGRPSSRRERAARAFVVQCAIQSGVAGDRRTSACRRARSSRSSATRRRARSTPVRAAISSSHACVHVCKRRRREAALRLEIEHGRQVAAPAAARRRGSSRPARSRSRSTAGVARARRAARSGSAPNRRPAALAPARLIAYVGSV